MISIREAALRDCDGIGRVTVAAALATFVDAIPAEHLDLSWTPEQSAAGWRTTLADPSLDRSLFLVAEHQNQIVGFVWAERRADSDGFDGSVRGLYVLPAQQGLGTGRYLFRCAVERLREVGATSLEVGCVQENPSCGFYRRLGGREIGRRPAKVDEYPTEEILFGWPDLEFLADQLRRSSDPDGGR